MNERSQTQFDSATSHTLRPGVYRHYKGRDYEVFGLVRHTETEEWLVHYRTLYGDHSHWVRPYCMFIEQIEVDGEPVSRFEYIGPYPGPCHLSGTEQQPAPETQRQDVPTPDAQASHESEA